MGQVDFADVMDFLEARLVEDETAAKTLKPGKNQHVARLRDRVLADIETKRGLMLWVQEIPWSVPDQPCSIWEDALANAVARVPLRLRSPVVFKLVAAYADHPDFPPEWKPLVDQYEPDECKLSSRAASHTA